MNDFINLKPVPSEEACAQIGEAHYDTRARAECKRYIALLRNTFGPEPSGAYLTTKCFPHDFGSYVEVICYFNPDVPESVAYALRCEREAPVTWGREEVEDANPSCPECGAALERGNGWSLSALVTGEVYLCTPCRMLFAHDLTFLATFIG